MSITTSTIKQYIGQNLFDESGSKIGKIGAVFLDDITGEPEWVTVSTGFFGTNESFVPAAGATENDGGLTVPYSKDKVKDAPNVDVEHGHLSSDEEENLYQYYGLQYSSTSPDPDRSDTITTDTTTTGTTTTTTDTTMTAADTGVTTGTTGNAAYRDPEQEEARSEHARSTESNVGRTDLVQRDADYDGDASTGLAAGPDGPDVVPSGTVRETAERETAGTDTSGRTTDDVMTRSEERLNVGTETVATGRARLRKWVETEHQQVDVPVRKEKARLETEPITDANRGDAFDGPAISEDEHVVTLNEERPVVSTETVPVERVRLGTETEEEVRTVDGEVRKERIDLDTDTDPGTGNRS